MFCSLSVRVVCVQASFSGGGKSFEMLVGGLLLLAAALTHENGALPPALACRPAAQQLTASSLAAHDSLLPVLAALLHAGAGPLLRCAEGGAAVGDGAEWQGRWLQCLTRCCALVRTLAIAAPSASDAVSDDEPSVRLPPLTRA